MPSFPGESEVVYTTDGTDPLTSATATSYTSTTDEPAATVTLPDADGAMTLKYAVRCRRPDQPGLHPGLHRARRPLGRQRDAGARGRSRRARGASGRRALRRDGRRAHRRDRSTTPPTGPVRASTAPATRSGRRAEFTSPIPVTRTTMITAISVPDPTAEVPGPAAAARRPVPLHHPQPPGRLGRADLRLPGHPHRHRPPGRPGRAPAGPGRARAVPRRPAVPGRRRPARPDPGDLVPRQLPRRVLLVVRRGAVHRRRHRRPAGARRRGRVRHARPCRTATRSPSAGSACASTTRSRARRTRSSSRTA